MSENLNQTTKQSVNLQKTYKDGKAKNVKVIRKYYGSAELKDIADKLSMFSNHFAQFSEQCLKKIQSLTDHIYDLNEKMDQVMIDRKFKRKMESGRAFDFGEDEEEEEDRGWQLWKGMSKD